jgi:hypothetical protein
VVEVPTFIDDEPDREHPLDLIVGERVEVPLCAHVEVLAEDGPEDAEPADRLAFDRDESEHCAVWTKDPRDLAQRCLRIVDVLEDVDQERDVDRRVLVWEQSRRAVERCKGEVSVDVRGLLDVAAEQRDVETMHTDGPEHLAAAAPDVDHDRAVRDAPDDKRGLEARKGMRGDVDDLA